MTPCNRDSLIVRSVMDELGFTPAIFTATSKWKARKSAHRAQLYRALLQLGWNVNRIARATGYIHSTIIYTLREHEESMKPRPSILNVLAAIEPRVRARIRLHEWDGLWERTGYVGLRRTPKLISARRIVFRHLRRAGFSFPEIAVVTTGRGHSTVVSALRPKTWRYEMSLSRQAAKARVCA